MIMPGLSEGIEYSTPWRLASTIASGSVDSMIAGTLSPEPGHAVQLEELGLEPVLQLGMRLGEGSGAALAIPVVRSAVAVLHEMGSFADLGLEQDRPTA